MQKRNQKPQKRRAPVNTTPQLMKRYKNLNPFVTHSRLKAIDNLFIQSGAVNPDLFFSGINQHYYNFANLAGLTDFTEAAAMYRYFRIRRVDFLFERVVDEKTMFDYTHGCAMFISYSPTQESITTPFTTASRDQSAYKFDLMTFDPQMVSWRMYNVLAFDNEKTNNSVILESSRANEIGGEVWLSDDNATNNPSAVNLFSVKVVFHLDMFYRY